MVLPSEVAVPPKKPHVSLDDDVVYIMENLNGNYLPIEYFMMKVREGLHRNYRKDTVARQMFIDAHRDWGEARPHLLNGMREEGFKYFLKLRNKYTHMLVSSRNIKEADTVVEVTRSNIDEVVEGIGFMDLHCLTQDRFRINGGKHFSVSVYGLDKIFESGRTYQS